MSQESVNAIADLVRAAEAIRTDDLPLYLIKNGEAKSLEALHEIRYQTRGTFECDRISALQRYVKARVEGGVSEKDVNIFVNPQSMQAKVFFDNFTAGGQGHCRDTAVCKISKTAAFEAILSIHAKRLSQKQFVDFLTDWHSSILGEKPLITAVRNVKITKKTEANSQINPLNTRTSVMEEVEARASGEVELPDTFTTIFEPYLGFGDQSFYVGIQALTEGDKIEFALRIEALESILEFLSERFASLISEAIGIEPHIGNFTP